MIATLRRIVIGVPAAMACSTGANDSASVGIPPSCGVRMPYGGPYLSAADTDVIRDWIAGGAAP
jgi:hypothetical protein